MPNNIQGNWRWCFKCQGLWFAAVRRFGVSWRRRPLADRQRQLCTGIRARPGQSGRVTGASARSATRCSSAGSQVRSARAGGAHAQAGSFNYSVSFNAPNIPEQSDWRWCNKCQGMFWAGAVAQSVSPTACTSIANDIQGLEADKAALQDDLQHASTPQKPALAAAINNLTKQISAKKTELTKCVNAHRLCPAGGSHFGASSGEYRIPQLPQNVRVHFKVLTTPTTFTTDTMLEQMRQVYNAVGIGVDLVSTETLNLPTLNDVDVGTCASSTTSEQTQLFNNRNNVNGNDLAIYFVRSTVPPLNGCAAHPSGRPGAVVVSTASKWTLGHEIGHVLGLPHCDSATTPSFDRLMTGQGTFNITNPPPNLVAGEVSTMKSSALTANA